MKLSAQAKTFWPNLTQFLCVFSPLITFGSSSSIVTKELENFRGHNLRVFTTDFTLASHNYEIISKAHDTFQPLQLYLALSPGASSGTPEQIWRFQAYRVVNLVTLSPDLALESGCSQLLNSLQHFSRKNLDWYLFLAEGPDLPLDCVTAYDLKYKLLFDPSQTIPFRIGVKHPTLDELPPEALKLPLTLFQTLDRSFKSELSGYNFRFSCASRVVAYIELAWNSGSWYAKRGYFKSIFDYVMQNLNASYTIFPGSGNGVAGVLLPNNTWIGVVGDVIRNEADFGTAAINHRGIQVADFTFPIGVEHLTFTHAKPLAFYTAKALVQPFHWHMWLLVLVVLLLQTALLTLFLRVYHPTAYGSTFKTPSEALLINSAILFEQLPTILDRGPARVKQICLLWSVFVLLIGTAYRSKLLGVLAFPSFEEYPSNFAELAMSKLKYGLLYYGGGAIMIFSSSKHPVYSKMYKNMETERDVYNCLNRTLREKFCCITYQFQARLELAKSFSDRFGRSPIVLEEPSPITVSVGIVTSKRSLLLDLLDSYVKHAQAHDLLRLWKEQDFDLVRKSGTPISTDLVSKEGEGVAKLTLKNLQGAFWIWVVSVAGCWGAFVLEGFIHATKKRLELSRGRWRLTWLQTKYFRKWRKRVGEEARKYRNRNRLDSQNYV